MGDAITASGAVNTSFATVSPTSFKLSDGQAADPSDPPFEWFLDPQFSGPTKMTVTDDGRIFGHACQWDTCHSGILDKCVLAPRGTDYSSYHLGVRYVNDSGQRSELAVGSLLMGTAHADHSLSPSEVANHYDDASTTVAHIRCGEDEYGVWFAGALVPGLSSTEVIQLRGASVSGDWRRDKGRYGFYGLIAVGVPGFPVKPSAVTAGGSVSSLHGFGIIEENEIVLDDDEVQRRVDTELSRRAKLEELDVLRDNLRAETLSTLAQPDSTKE